MDARHNNKTIIKGIILTGSADFKNQIVECSVSYGGLNQAIELVSSDLENVELIKEKNIISDSFEHISKDSRLFFFWYK